MGSFFETLLIILIIVFALGPIIRRWLAPMFQRWAMGQMEDRMRRMAGMPIRKEERREERRARKRGARGGTAGQRVSREWEETVRGGGLKPADYMRSYAEDVEFEEIKTKKED